MGFAGAGAVVVDVEGDEVEELLGVGGDVGADECSCLAKATATGERARSFFWSGNCGDGVCRR